MNSRALGRTGIEVIELGLGAWQLGEPSWNGPGEQESLLIVDEALLLGCTSSTPRPPTAAGAANSCSDRRWRGAAAGWVLCTKFGYWPDRSADLSPERIEESVQASLRRLRTDHLDVLLLHSPPDPTVLEASARTM